MTIALPVNFRLATLIVREGIGEEVVVVVVVVEEEE
jgi:hypothetical protein